jgi:hypothetical protein
MRGWRMAYWFLAGTLLGVGVAALPSIGIFLLPIGLILLVVGLIRYRGREIWALPVGVGMLPAILVEHTILTIPSACSPNGLTAQDGNASCSGPIPELYYRWWRASR